MLTSFPLFPTFDFIRLNHISRFMQEPAVNRGFAGCARSGREPRRSLVRGQPDAAIHVSQVVAQVDHDFYLNMSFKLAVWGDNMIYLQHCIRLLKLLDGFYCFCIPIDSKRSVVILHVHVPTDYEDYLCYITMDFVRQISTHEKGVLTILPRRSFCCQFYSKHLSHKLFVWRAPPFVKGRIQSV